MKILIVEDEAPATRRLTQLLKEIDGSIEILDCIDSIENTVKWLKHHQSPDIILMDIQLADGLSFEIFEKIQINIPVIFTTAYDEYTLKAFKVNSIDYLLKPIKKEELSHSLQKLNDLQKHFSQDNRNQLQSEVENLLKSLKTNQKEYKTRFLVKLGERLVALNVDEVAYFQAEEKIVLLITKEGKKYAVDYSLDELENLVSPDSFFRLNRQYIAHFQSIKTIHTYFNGKLKLELIPDIKQEVLISREKSSIFKEWLDK